MSDPVRVSGGGSGDYLADHDPDVWCRTQTARIKGSRGGSDVYSVTSQTDFCWDGDELASHDPRFSHRIKYLNAFWSGGVTNDNENGGIGDWEHWDYVAWSFQRCVGGTCFDSIHPWVEKEQRGNGNGEYSYSRR